VTARDEILEKIRESMPRETYEMAVREVGEDGLIKLALKAAMEQADTGSVSSSGSSTDFGEVVGGILGLGAVGLAGYLLWLLVSYLWSSTVIWWEWLSGHFVG
jgi:hypothetical protein